METSTEAKLVKAFKPFAHSRPTTNFQLSDLSFLNLSFGVLSE